MEELLTDAWQQLHDLLEEFTLEIDVRSDIEVVGHATQRAVELRIGKTDYGKDRFEKGRTQWMSTGTRNVDTMRELAWALLQACDFVDQSNPTWAQRRIDE